MKETALVNYIDKQLLRVSRRHAKKFSRAIGQQEQTEDDRGYESFREVVKDLEAIIDVVWVSGTRMRLVTSTSLPGSLLWTDR
jgi:Subunit 11 of the general transcription factor TFIIH